MRKIRCIKSEDAAVCEGCLSKDIACTFVYKKEMSGKTKRVQQAKQTFGSLRQETKNSSEIPDIQVANLPGLLHTFREQIWLIVPTTNVGATCLRYNACPNVADVGDRSIEYKAYANCATTTSKPWMH